ELVDEPFIGMLPGYGTRMLLDSLAQDAGFSPRFVFESMELTTVSGLVAAGLGCALLPLDDPYLNATNLIPLEPVRYRELGVVWRVGDDAPPVLQFRGFIRRPRQPEEAQELKGLRSSTQMSQLVERPAAARGRSGLFQC